MADATNEDHDREGVLFKNRWKALETDPDYSGKLRIEGVEWRIYKDGVRYLRLTAVPSGKPRDARSRARRDWQAPI